MEKYFKCELFENKAFSPSEKFSIFQHELTLNDDIIKNSTINSKVPFKNQKIEYKCQWKVQENWDSEKPTILIPIRDDIDLINITIKNLKEKGVADLCNIIIIDDRSVKDVRSLVIESNLSYLRIDHNHGFNFSMLNNIAAKIGHCLGVGTIILWNSDLWCVKKEWFSELLTKHKENGATISGSKLLYPPAEMSLNNEEDTKNIKTTFPHMMGGKWRETVQFGGSFFTKLHNQYLNFVPNHYLRFGNKSDPRVNCDKGENFITGALQVIDLQWFVKSGGLNPSLKKGFQDVDVCLKALKDGQRVFYFGKDMYFYHDESANFYSNKDEKKQDIQATSDHILFGKLWNDQMAKILFT
jgi:GT2 family glycosyltransferase